jgi:hypothetical protein
MNEIISTYTKLYIYRFFNIQTQAPPLINIVLNFININFIIPRLLLTESYRLTILHN